MSAAGLTVVIGAARKGQWVKHWNKESKSSESARRKMSAGTHED